MGQRSVPAPFLTKTYQLVDDRSSDDVISWNDDGSSFVVWKTADFAKDLLPNYFKHNNFSSFVRQLNTYGFRKVVPDKWEFANENFRRGRKELLAEIRRRKTVASAPETNQNGGKAAATSSGPSSPSNSVKDPGSSSTSSPDSKNPGSVETPAAAAVQCADLSEENEKLMRDNQMLSLELAQTKKRCDELVAFLTRRLKVAPDQINRIMRQGSLEPTLDWSVAELGDTVDDGEDGTEAEEGLKLFGVVLKSGKKKRAREENTEFGGAPRKETKTVGRLEQPIKADD